MKHIENDFNKRAQRAKSLLVLAAMVVAIFIAMIAIGLIQRNPVAGFYLVGTVITGVVIYKTMSDVEKSTIKELVRTFKALYGFDNAFLMKLAQNHKSAMKAKENKGDNQNE